MDKSLGVGEAQPLVICKEPNLKPPRKTRSDGVSVLTNGGGTGFSDLEVSRFKASSSLEEASSGMTDSASTPSSPDGDRLQRSSFLTLVAIPGWFNDFRRMGIRQVRSSREGLHERISVFSGPTSLPSLCSLRDISDRREVLNMAEKDEVNGDFVVGEVECCVSISLTTNAPTLHATVSPWPVASGSLDSAPKMCASVASRGSSSAVIGDSSWTSSVFVPNCSRVLLRFPSWSSEGLDRFGDDVFVGGFERRFRFRSSLLLLSVLAGLLEGAKEDLSRENIAAFKAVGEEKKSKSTRRATTSSR